MNKKILAALAAGSAIVLLAGCAGGGSDDTSGKPSAAAEPELVRIGVVDASQEYWSLLTEKAAEEGIEVELVNFSGYTEENPALTQDQIDLNLFQHLQFLGQYNVEAGEDLVPIGATLIYPLGLYSNEHADVSEIPDGGEITIPNDPTNQGRALSVLEAAGLITLTGDVNNPTPADIDEAASKVTVTPIDAAQTVASLASVDGAVINNNFIADAGIDPESRLFADDPTIAAAQPYINVIVARAEDKDNPTYQRIVELYHSPEVQEAAVEASAGTGIPVTDVSQEELQEILTRVEDDASAAK